jgi:Bacterial TSP3 repeat
LSANRIYYFQVVSRDQAGNTTVDDNGGNFYTFHTLKAPAPPWFDNLESGAPGWTVVPDPAQGSDINWTLGTPHNALVTSAHSGINVWGSDLDGDQNFVLASSFLYSPVIDLSGLTSATLTFSNVYDFSRVDPSFGFYIEDGGVFVSTNSSVPPSLNLPLVVDFADGVAATWQKETLDLTPFVGKTIQVVFYYQAISFGDTINGWTLDDIGITGVAAGGTIQISKNLGQGNWSLSALSPIGLVPVQSGVAPAVTISNLAAGQYVVQFGDVPWYQTPAATTNTLAAGGTLNFTGNYDFLDANHNGISDSWEMNSFSAVTTNRTQFTDTDHDGMTDYAEFIAGTDPANPASRFYFTGETVQSNRLVQLQWTVITNRLYQVNASTNLLGWQPVTDWLQASNNPTMSYTVTNSGGARFFRVQVRP